MVRVLKQKECLHILTNNYIGNLAYIYRDRPFIAPITYFFDAENNIIIGYSAEGHKINAMRKNSNVSVNVAEIDSVNDWKSVLAHGSFEELSSCTSKAKLHQFSIGVKDLIITREHRKLDFINEFSSKIYTDDLPVIFQIKVKEITGKMRSHNVSA
jgi:nitroimidazol reductase NimA-like FMN-containing flavoprotein (pyridoxamine 5'-phosphate oxidase superfamily)